MAVHVRIRPDQFVPRADVERQFRALLPVVLDERIERSATQIGYTTGLQRRLLRNAEQKIGECRAGRAGHLTATRRIQTCERERATRIRIELAVALIESKIATDPHLVLAENVHPRL